MTKEIPPTAQRERGGQGFAPRSSFDHLGNLDTERVHRWLRARAGLRRIFRDLRDHHPSIGPAVLVLFILRIADNHHPFPQAQTNRLLRTEAFPNDEAQAVRAHLAHRKGLKTPQDTRTPNKTTQNPSRHGTASQQPKEAAK